MTLHDITGVLKITGVPEATGERNEDGTYHVKLTVTSPPYDGIRDYNGYTFDWKATIQELYRITKRGGGNRLDRQRSDRGRERNGNLFQASPVRSGMRIQSA